MDGIDETITVFTIGRILYGVSFIGSGTSIAADLVKGTEYEEAVNQFIEKMSHMNEIERTSNETERGLL